MDYQRSIIQSIMLYHLLHAKVEFHIKIHQKCNESAHQSELEGDSCAFLRWSAFRWIKAKVSMTSKGRVVGHKSTNIFHWNGDSRESHLRTWVDHIASDRARWISSFLRNFDFNHCLCLREKFFFSFVVFRANVNWLFPLNFGYGCRSEFCLNSATYRPS